MENLMNVLVRGRKLNNWTSVIHYSLGFFFQLFIILLKFFLITHN